MTFHRHRTLMIGMIVALPVVVAVWILVTGERWFPAGDMAQAELHMRGFFHRPPLVGAAGRIVSDSGFQGSHPGPSLWFAMLPVYLLGGRSSSALMAAAASVHVLSIAGILFLAQRRFGRAFTVATAFVLLAILRSAGADFMIEPWNPWLALLPFAVFVLLINEVVDPVRVGSARSSSDDRNHLVAAVIVGSHCLQSHAGYALLVVPALAAALGVSVWRAATSKNPPESAISNHRIRSLVLVSLGTTFLVWLPPLVDQIRRKPGNLTILIQHFGSPEEPTIGLAKTVDVLVSQLNVLGPWLLGPAAPSDSVVKWIGFAGFIGIVTAAILSRRSRVHRSTFAVLLGFVLLGAISILRIFGPFYEYTVRWLWLLTGLLLATAIWTLWDAVRTSTRMSGRSKSLVQWCALAGVMGLSALTVVQVANRVTLPGATDSRILGGLMDDTVANLDPTKTYQVRFYDPYTLNATGFGLVLELERRGFDVKVDPEFAAAALPHRTAPMEQTDEVLWVVVGPALQRALQDPVLTPLATFNPRSTEQQARAGQLLSEVEAGLRAAGRTDLVASLEAPGASILFTVPPLPERTAELVRELIRMGQPTGVFSMAVSDVALSLG